MNKIVKSLLLVGGATLAASFGLKAYKRINGIVKLSKSLPEFLNNVYGETPKVNMTKGLGTMYVKVFFTQETLDKHTDIETTVREYIDDFYPDLGKAAVDITVGPIGSEEEQSCCGEGEETEASPETDEA